MVIKRNQFHVVISATAKKEKTFETILKEKHFSCITHKRYLLNKRQGESIHLKV